MTHVQNIWTAQEVYPRVKDVTPENVATLRTWCKSNPKLVPTTISDEQLILFLHSNYSHLENTKQSMEDYYKLQKRAPQFFKNRDIAQSDLQKALQVLHYGIFSEKNPKGYKVLFHGLKELDPSRYSFNEGFKLLCMAMESVYIREGPHPGIILLFDLKGVKLGHVTRLPLMSVKRALEYIQDANPVRLKGIHIINVHPIIDKIMLLIRPFLKKQFLSLLHFHKEGDESVHEVVPKSLFPSEYGGELPPMEKIHAEFMRELEELQPVFTADEALMSKFLAKQKTTEEDINIGRLEID